MVNRHKLILERLSERKYIEVADLCGELQVSAVTIRKDLKFLEQKQLLFRTHGGASLENPYINDRPVNEKEKIRVAEKKAIGNAAAQLIRNNEAIILASGTTILALARAIQAPESKLTIITSALNTAQELLHHPNTEVIQLGGSTRQSSSSVTGPYAEKMLEDTFCNKLFLGVDGIDFEYGLTTTNIAEAQLNQKMISVSQEVVVLADSGKFGKRGFGRICSIDQISHIITDAGIRQDVLRKFRDSGITVTVVDPGVQP